MKDGKYSVGVIGLGHRGIYLGTEAFLEEGSFYLSCTCDISLEIVEYVKSITNDDVKCYTDVDEFLTHPDLDAVIIATNDKTHADIAVKVLRAKKHLFLEKPMAQTIADCDRIVKAWEGSDTVFIVGLELRYCSLMQDTKAIIDRGDIGRIITGTVVDNVSVGGDYYFHDKRRKKEYTKSLILEKGTHSLDLANWIVDDSPYRVYASGGLDVFGGEEPEDKTCVGCEKAATCHYYRNRDTFVMDYGVIVNTEKDLCVYSKGCEVSDNSLVIVDYINGARISYMECHFTPEYTREFMFVGDKGKLTAFYNNEQDFKIMVWKRHEKEPVYYYPEKREGGHGGGDAGIIREFAARLKKGKPCMVGVKGARDSAAIAIAAFESEESGVPVMIPTIDWPHGDE